MAKFILSTRQAGRSLSQPDGVKASLEQSLGLFEGSATVSYNDADPHRRQTAVIEGERSHMERVRAQMPGEILVEEAIDFRKLGEPAYDLMRAVPLDYAEMMLVEPMAHGFAGKGQRIEIEVFGRTNRLVPLAGSEVHIFLAGPGSIRDRLVDRTDGNGRVTFEVGPFYRVLGVLAVPYSDYWPKIHRGSISSRVLRIDCERPA